MSVLKLVLLCVVGLLVNGQPTFDKDYTAVRKVELLKSLMEFEDKNIYERWLVSEERTCNEVENVLQTMKDNVKSDLSRLMTDVWKHLEHVPRPGNTKKRNCIRDIKEDIEQVIKDGLKSFSQCTKPYAFERDEMKIKIDEERLEYKENFNYTLGSIDGCLRYSSVHNKIHLDKCIEGKIRNVVEINTRVYGLLNSSKCMSFFTNYTLYCTTSVFREVYYKKREINKDIAECVGYTLDNQDENNFGEAVKHILSDYTVNYNKLNEEYKAMIRKYFMFLLNWSMKEEDDLSNRYQYKLKKSFQGYYRALDMTMDENWSKNERQCSLDAKGKIDALINEASADFDQCHRNKIEQGNNDINTFNRTLLEFYDILPEAGNVALLRCIGQRPQQVFGSKATERCAYLAMRNITVKWITVKREMEKLDKMYDVLRLPEGQPCDGPRDQKLQVEIDWVMFDCERCLFGINGNYYAVTSPVTNIPLVSFNSSFIPSGTTSHRKDDYQPQTTGNYNDYSTVDIKEYEDYGPA